MNEKLILTDADGVLLDWSASFDEWMTEKGYTKVRSDTWCLGDSFGIDPAEAIERIKEFNLSEAVAHIKPVHGSVEHVKRLYEERGYKFHVITSLSDSGEAAVRRMTNLRNLFGDAISEMTVLALDASKAPTLEKYKNSGLWWIEDKFENAVVGADLGLRSLLLNQAYNEKFYDHRVIREHSWNDIYDRIEVYDLLEGLPNVS